jgi:hypothetical protein
MAEKGHSKKTDTSAKDASVLDPSPTQERTDDLVDLVRLPNGSVAAGSDGFVETQAARLSDRRLPAAQRQALAAQVARVGGNRQLQRVVASESGEKIAPYQLDTPTASAGTASEAVMKKDADAHCPVAVRKADAAKPIGEVVSVVGAGQYAPGTIAGQQLVAQKSTQAVPQASDAVIQRAVGDGKKITKLQQLLQDDQEDAAIALMGKLSPDEVKKVLSSRELKELAIRAFDNDEMYRAIRAMRGDLYPSLKWLFAEGSDWDKLRKVIVGSPSGKKSVRADDWMKRQFVSVCNDEEMTEAVDLLGGSLLEKLSWIYAEGVGDWDKIKAKITATGVTQKQKADVRENADIKDFFVKELSDKQMMEALDLLGGTLYWKLQWMKAKEVSGRLVRKRIRAATAARTPKNVAIDLVKAFKADTSSPQAFPKLSKVDICSGLLARINNPSLIRQKGLNACGPAAAAYVFAQQDVVGYTNMAISLFKYGVAIYGSYTIKPGSDLRSFGPNDYSWGTGSKPEPIDWMVLSSMRDAENWAVDFEGGPADTFSGITTPGEMEDWLTDFMGFKKVVDETNLVSTKGIDHLNKVNSEQASGKYVILLINANMFSGLGKKAAKKAAKKAGAKTEKITAGFPNHYVVLRDQIKVNSTVKMKVWTWGQTNWRTIPKKAVKDNYYGAIFAQY